MIIIDSVRMIMYVHQPEKVATCIAMLGFWVSNSLAMELKFARVGPDCMPPCVAVNNSHWEDSGTEDDEHAVF